MSKKIGKELKKKPAASAGAKNSLLRATVVSQRGDEPLQTMHSAIDSFRRTFSLPRTLLSKGRTQVKAFADTRFELSSLTAAATSSIDEYSPRRNWLPRPLKRIKFGVLSILVIIGLSIGMLSATGINGPYHSIKSWVESSRMGQMLGLKKDQAGAEKVLDVSQFTSEPAAMPKTPAMVKKISKPQPDAKVAKAKAKGKEKTKAKVKAKAKKKSVKSAKK